MQELTYEGKDAGSVYMVYFTWWQTDENEEGCFFWAEDLGNVLEGC